MSQNKRLWVTSYWFSGCCCHSSESLTSDNANNASSQEKWVATRKNLVFEDSRRLDPVKLLNRKSRRTVQGEDYYYAPGNVTRITISGIQAYRSALTLDWLAAEDTRQRELVAAYETEPSAPARIITTECINYPRPSSGKVGKLMLELLKNLEGDDGVLVPELIHVLVRTKLLVETSMLDSEPDLESLVKTPMMMMGEPHITFPRILAIVWMLVTDTSTTRNNGWCPLLKVNKYLMSTKPTDIAKHLRVLEPVIARARFIMEEFIQNVTPLNMFQKQTEEITPLNDFDTTPKELPTNERGDILAKLPRSSGEEMEQSEDQDQPELPSLEPEYPSSPVLDQAQQIGYGQDEIEGETKSNAVAIYGLTPLLVLSSNVFGVWLVNTEVTEPATTDRRQNRLFKRQDDMADTCSRVKSTPRDIVRRVYAIMPYFDKDHANTAFLHKYRATIHGMSEGEDLLDREAALYASILTPLVFLQQYRDTWCLLERFHRAVRLYQISHPTEKRSSLKLLQNFRAVNQKIRSFIMELPGRRVVSRTSAPIDNEEEEIHDKKDIRYLKELIKNLG
ncbi:hypothetical protein RR48_03861 [Papilio machaon]|uniref:Uncharacterized protein n=1 Tax=Papilio machaon TaxID=76193 RepID=A0A0N1IB73_PAPMA|nr:hypothetical protein RR48_03861 [Papilio machaon]